MPDDRPRAALTVERVGIATIQDLGRPGYAHLGISGNGASDVGAALLANLVVGNRRDAPLIEITGTALTITASIPLLIGVTGAADAVRVGSKHRPVSAPLTVRPGDVVEVPAPRSGLRSYLAFNGDLVAPRLLGSVAPDRLLGFDHRLAKGDRVHLTTRFDGTGHSPGPIVPPRLAEVSGVRRGGAFVEITPGPESDEFDGSLQRLQGFVLQVSPQSDAMGLRLEGEPLRRKTKTELLSRGVPVGAIEVPPRGPLLALLRARYVTAGYPVVAVATTMAVDVLAQLRAGQTVRLRPTTTDQAVRRLARREEDLAQIERRVRAAFFYADLKHCLP